MRPPAAVSATAMVSLRDFRRAVTSSRIDWRAEGGKSLVVDVDIFAVKRGFGVFDWNEDAVRVGGSS